MIQFIEARSLEIPFKAVFSHASASRESTHSIWVNATLRDGANGHGEGCPRNYVTGETLEGTLEFVSRFREEWMREISDFDSLVAWTRGHRVLIDSNPAAWCAVELALLDAISTQARKTIEAQLGLQAITGQFLYTAVIGDSAAKRFQAEILRYQQAGFRSYKIKLSGNEQRDLDKITLLKAAGISPALVRADANNLWTDADAAVRFLQRLDYRFHALEEPLRAGDLAGMNEIAANLGCSIILDESLARADQLAQLRDFPARWIPNLRVSKMGGLVRSLELVDDCRRAGLRLIVGAHVGETSLLTRAALCVASAARDLLVAQEGAFGTHLLEHDVIDPPIMFGAGGTLDARSLPQGTGLGLSAVLTNQ